MVTPLQLNLFIFFNRSLFRPMRSPELFRLTGVEFDQQEVQKVGSVILFALSAVLRGYRCLLA
jgi:hypothetical protein